MCLHPSRCPARKRHFLFTENSRDKYDVNFTHNALQLCVPAVCCLSRLSPPHCTCTSTTHNCRSRRFSFISPPLLPSPPLSHILLWFILALLFPCIPWHRHLVVSGAPSSQHNKHQKSKEKESDGQSFFLGVNVNLLGPQSLVCFFVSFRLTLFVLFASYQNGRYDDAHWQRHDKS